MGRRPYQTWIVTIYYTHAFPYQIKAKDAAQARERAIAAHKQDEGKYNYIEAGIEQTEE